MRQTCKACGRSDKFDFYVPDHVWLAIVPHHLSSRVVCLACFDEFARAKKVEYADSLVDLWFAGDRAVFQFSATTRVNV